MDDHSDVIVGHGERCQALICPRCRGNNLHHGTVKVYERFQEDGDGTITTVLGGSTKLRFAKSEEIPWRRGRVEIAFFCEYCDSPDTEEDEQGCEALSQSMPTGMRLVIEQHKGTTYLYFID